MAKNDQKKAIDEQTDQQVPPVQPPVQPGQQVPQAPPPPPVPKALPENSDINEVDNVGKKTVNDWATELRSSGWQVAIIKKMNGLTENKLISKEEYLGFLKAAMNKKIGY